ncbi:MAG: hypothetical protein HON43_01685 [Alphaproteobacteria bacterium]|jgi:hypothetical protein|nr:hypothetical protein [Alphaproteobacteria bacterium]MBT5390622.1 hypothetical protein [Alphaproteobacteria bacterium]MBT5540784.1 hypothetical protein [Alphaproteobacteria bacterium]
MKSMWEEFMKEKDEELREEVELLEQLEKHIVASRQRRPLSLPRWALMQ